MDKAVVAELYRRHVPALRGFAYVLTAGDRAAAEDLLHDAFIRATGRLVALRDPDAFEAYLRRAVVNAVTSRHVLDGTYEVAW
jgi:DNA-directed RNA polymerase specialized sigma24 family protein